MFKVHTNPSFNAGQAPGGFLPHLIWWQSPYQEAMSVTGANWNRVTSWPDRLPFGLTSHTPQGGSFMAEWFFCLLDAFTSLPDF
jgi:hypothetical protein